MNSNDDDEDEDDDEDNGRRWLRFFFFVSRIERLQVYYRPPCLSPEVGCWILRASLAGET